MRPTPGTLRQFAQQAENDVPYYLARAQQSDDPDRKRYFLRCAENRHDDARFYLDLAGRGEIEVEYQVIEPIREAAE